MSDLAAAIWTHNQLGTVRALSEAYVAAEGPSIQPRGAHLQAASPLVRLLATNLPASCLCHREQLWSCAVLLLLSGWTLAVQGPSEHEALLAGAGCLCDAMHAALEGCLPRLQKLLAQAREAFPDASDRELYGTVERAVQEADRTGCLAGALRLLLSMQASLRSSGRQLGM